MSTYLNISAVSTAFAGLTFTGITTRAASTMPEALLARDCPLLAPAPNYLSNVVVERDSFGAPMDMRQTITYTLSYRYYHAAVGSTRGLLDIYDALIGKVDLIISTVIDNTNLTGTVDINPTGATAPSVVTDPAGNQFYGCDLTFQVTVFVR